MSVTTEVFEATVTVEPPIEGFAKPRFKIKIVNGQHGKAKFDQAQRASFACPGCGLPTNLPFDVLLAIHQHNGRSFRFPCPRADCGFPIVINVE